jgi:WD40-like Beta Propeller Repeat
MAAPVLAYVHNGNVMVADAAGHHAVAEAAPSSRYSTPHQPTWSPDGRWLGWTTTDGELYVYDARRGVTRAWPCPCGGLAFEGQQAWTIESDGSALLSMDGMTGSTTRTHLSGLKNSEYPEVLGALAGEILIGGAREGQTGVSGGPTHFFVASPDGRVRAVGVDRNNSQVSATQPEANGRLVAYVSDAASGVCDDFESIALLDLQNGRIQYPGMPPSSRPWSIPWFRWTTDGLQAMFEHDPECPRAGSAPSGHHPSDLGVWTLVGHSWRRAKREAVVSESASRLTATITPRSSPNDTFSLAGVLTVRRVGGPDITVTKSASELAMRP